MGHCLAIVQLCPPFCAGYVQANAIIDVNTIINSYFQRHLAAILQQLETWDKSRSMTDHLSTKYPSLRDNNRTNHNKHYIINGMFRRSVQCRSNAQCMGAVCLFCFIGAPVIEEGFLSLLGLTCVCSCRTTGDTEH